MAVDVIMPAMGATQETGRLVRWFKREGDSITKGEMLMEVETDKSVVEVEAPASGILTKVTAAPDDEIPVGQAIALIVEPGEAVSGTGEVPGAGPRRKVPARKKAKPPTAPKRAPATTPSTGRFLASPAAKRLAKERGVEIAGIQGTGPEGAVVARDVLSTVRPLPPRRARRFRRAACAASSASA